LVGQGTEFVAFVLLARRLGTADFGRLSVAFLACRYLGLVGDWGASVRGVRDVAAGRHPDSIRALDHRRRLVTAVLVAAALAGFTGFGRLALAPLVATIAGRGLNRDWLALGRERGVVAGLPPALQGMVVLGATSAAHGPFTAAEAIGVGYSLALVVSLGLNRLPEGTGQGDLRVDAWLLVAVLADQVTASTDTVLLAALRSASQAGIYAAIYRIPNAWLTVIGLLVLGVVPWTARSIAAEPERTGELRARAGRIGARAAAGILCTIPVSWWAVPRLFGTAYRPGQQPLAILLVATAMNAAAAPLHPIFLAVARDRLQAAIFLGAASLNIVGNLVFIPRWGMTAAASTTLAAQIVLLLAFWHGIPVDRRDRARVVTPAVVTPAVVTPAVVMPAAGRGSSGTFPSDQA